MRLWPENAGHVSALVLQLTTSRGGSNNVIALSQRCLETKDKNRVADLS